MPLLSDQKFSTFALGGSPTTGDIIVGLRGGINTQFNFTSAGIEVLTGTINQVLVNGTYGVPTTGPVVLTTPQNIDTHATFQVNSVQFNSNQAILDKNGNIMLEFGPVASAVNFLTLENGSAALPQVVIASDGASSDISILFHAKGLGQYGWYTNATINQFQFINGPASVHTTAFQFANTATTNIVTWPDTSGTVVMLDANNNLSANNFISGYATTATAASTTTLSVSSAYQQFFTGITTQTVQMPQTNTLALGQSWYIVNNSSGTVTVQSYGSNTITTLAAGAADVITCISKSVDTAAAWSSEASGASGVTSITGTASQVIASAATGNVTLSLPQNIATGSSPTFAGLTLSSPLTLANGGTSANLTASNGGIFYSTASAAAILSGTATANLPLLSASSTAPVWGSFALSLGGALTTAAALSTSGAFGATFTFTNTTSVTFPNSGTLLTSAGAVTSITGTANEIIASASVGGVTLSTPQSLATTAAFQVNTIQLNSNQILDSNGYVALSLNSAGSANYVSVQNAGGGASPYARVFGSDLNINFSFQTKGTGAFIFISQALTTSFIIYNGTSNQHSTSFAFANTSANQTATFPDATFTIAGTTVALSGTGASSFNAYGPVFGGTTSTGALQSITAGTSGQILVSSGAGVLPAWSTSTYPTTNAINTILYASAANTMSALATANSSVLITSSGGVPSWSTTLPSGLSATNLTLVTPTLGAATATSLAFSPTTGGIVGTTAADNAGAGKVGELLSSANATSVAQSTGSTTQIQTLSLTAGDWDVWAIYYTAVGGTTVQTLVQAQLNTSSATIVAPTTVQLASIAGNYSTVITGQAVYLNLGISRWNVSGATTVYLNAAATYSASTLTGNGAIFARRVR